MVPEADAEDRLQVSLQQEVWEVDFPHEVVKLEHLEGWTALHEAASYHCRATVQDLGSFLPDDGVVSALAVECGKREAERQWYEESLAAVQPWYEISSLLRSLQTEVPLSPAKPQAPEQFLQTRTESLDEAKKELCEWLEPAREEIMALEQTTGAVERVTTRDVDNMVKQSHASGAWQSGPNPEERGRSKTA